MIVYGDPSFRAGLRPLVDAAITAVRAAETAAESAADEWRTRDAVRGVLVRAGQIEQAVADSHESDGAVAASVVAGAECITDAGASALVALARGRTAAAHARLAAARGRLEALARGPDPDLTVKVPEGFAFYALFPEQYIAAARSWSAGMDEDSWADRVLVVGLRSIGTALSAVVAEALRADGWRVRRCTVRPRGHPYERRVDLPRGATAGIGHAIVVDEGPGASGSSMAAAAAALAAAGVPVERITLMPGHAGEPGPKAGDDVRAWWGRVRRIVGGAEGPEWGPAGSLAGLLGAGTDVCDIGAGRWRRHLAEAEREGSIATPLFERPKHLATVDGRARTVWAFAGFAPGDDGADGAQRTAQRCAALAARGWTVAPAGCTAGFVAAPWVDGIRLQRDDLTALMAERLGAYIAAAAGPSLPPAECAAAAGRVRTMAVWNVKLALGEEASRDAERRLSEAAAVLGREALAGAGDGRMAPWEWIRRGDGSIIKVDCGGHERDHTVVGAQPLAWDVAGAAVEWGMPPHTASLVARAAGIGEPPAGVLPALRLGYAALRLGQCEMCLGAAGDTGDRRMLGAGVRLYTDEIRRALADQAGMN